MPARQEREAKIGTHITGEAGTKGAAKNVDLKIQSRLLCALAAELLLDRASRTSNQTLQNRPAQSGDG